MFAKLFNKVPEKAARFKVEPCVDIGVGGAVEFNYEIRRSNHNRISGWDYVITTKSLEEAATIVAHLKQEPILVY